MRWLGRQGPSLPSWPSDSRLWPAVRYVQGHGLRFAAGTRLAKVSRRLAGGNLRARNGLRILGFESVTKGDTVFRDLVLARIIEPTSKIDAERVLTELGVEPASYATVKRRLPIYAKPDGGNRWPAGNSPA
jgi:hypothetical protein